MEQSQQIPGSPARASRLFTLRMVGNNVLLSPMEAPTASPGGVFYPQGSSPSTKMYRVLAVGPGRVVTKRGKDPVVIPCGVTPGDRVLSEMHLGHKGVVEDGHGRIVCDARELIAVIEL